MALTQVQGGMTSSPTLMTVNAGGTNPFPSSSGPTVVDFTSIPSWVKRITVMFSGVSLNAIASILVQVGTTTPTTTGYVSSCPFNAGSGGVGIITSTSGFIFQLGDAGYAVSGSLVITNVSGNVWVSNGSIGNVATTPYGATTGGTVTLASGLNMVRITTTTGTTLFDAGSINVLYEG